MPASDYTPGVDAVAAYIRARTKTQGGDEAGTFNPAAYASDNSGRGTRPTAEQVVVEITKAVNRVRDAIGEDIPPANFETAKELVALYAASLVELNYWPEQVNAGRSTYPQLKALWDEQWKEFLASLGETADSPSADAGYPSYGGFPTTGVGVEFAW